MIDKARDDTPTVRESPIRGEIRMVPLSLLNVDEDYQRPLRQTHVKKLVRTWDDDAVGLLHVGDRAGVLYLADGQHRAEAMRQLGKTFAPCIVFQSRGKEHEANVFTKGNEGLHVQAINKLRSRVEAHDPEALAIVKLVTEAGWTIEYSGAKIRCPRTTASAYSIQECYRRNPDRLALALRYLIETWPDDVNAGQGRVIEGMFAFLGQAGDILNRRRFVERLRTEHLASLIRRGIYSGREQATSPAFGIARELATRYNGRLPARYRVVLVGRYTHHDDDDR